MPTNLRLLTLAAFALAPAVAAADDTYTFKTPKPAEAGDRARVNVVSKSDNEFSVLDAGGMVVNSKKEKKGHTAVCVETVLAKEKGKKPSKLSAAFDKATVTIEGKEEDAGLKGKTVVVERDGKNVTFKLEDGTEPSGTALTFLKEVFKGNENEDPFEATIFPKKPVKVSDSWPADLEEMARQIGGGGENPVAIDVKKSTGTCKLLKAYMKDGRPFATIDVDIKLAIQQIGEGERAIKLNTGSFFTFKGTGDVTIDGGPNSGTVAMKLEMSGTGKVSSPDGQQFTIKLTVRGQENDTHTPLPAK